MLDHLLSEKIFQENLDMLNHWICKNDADGTDDELDNEDVTGDVEPKCTLAEQCEFNISALFYWAFGVG